MRTTPATGLHELRPDVDFPREAESRRSRVLVDVEGEIVEISRRDRDVLLEELCFVPDCTSIRERFEAVREAGAVELDLEERSRLRAVLEVWVQNGLAPDGIVRFLGALVRADDSAMARDV